MGFFDKFKRRQPPQKVTAEEKIKKVEKTLEELRKEEGRKEEKKPAVIKKEVKEDTGSAYRVLLRPVVTEKSAVLADAGQYVFEVNPLANKIEISKAVRDVYGVKPVRVNLIRTSGKLVTRYGQPQGRTKLRRKAIVTLSKGEKIPLFEGAT